MAQERQGMEIDDQIGTQGESGRTQPNTESAASSGTIQRPATHTARHETTTTAETRELSIRQKLEQIKAEIEARKTNKQSKVSGIVEYLLSHNTDTISAAKIAEIMGEGKVSPENRLQIMGLQNQNFVRHNLSLTRSRDGSMRIIQGNPSHEKNELQEKSDPAEEPDTKTPTIPQPQEPQPDQRAPYSAPIIESQAIKDINTKARLAQLNIETVDQLWKVALATREEVNAALIDAIKNPHIKNNTSGRVKRQDGNPVNTQVYLLENFLETRTATQGKLAIGFPDTQALKIARNNANNSKNNIFKKHKLRIEFVKDTKEPEKSKWILESERVKYVQELGNKTPNIYASAKEIKENDTLFTDAPRFSQFILGALSDLTMGATLEEFSFVTGLTEKEILKAVAYINTSVIPQTRRDIKIHNRNGVLILGTKDSAVQIETLETRTATINWKTVVFEIRERIGNTQAIEIEVIIEPEDTVVPAEALPTEAVHAEQIEPAGEEIQDIQTKLSTVLANHKTGGAQETLLKALVGTTGEIPLAKVAQIIEESGLRRNLQKFVANTRRPLIKVGLTLEIDKEKQVVRLTADTSIPKASEEKPADTKDTSASKASEEHEEPVTWETEPTQKTSFGAKLEKAIASGEFHLKSQTRDVAIQILSAMTKEFDKHGKPLSPEEIVSLTKLSDNETHISNHTVGHILASAKTKAALEEIGIYIEVRRIRKPSMTTLYSFTTTPQENIETNPDEIKQIFETTQKEGKIKLDENLFAIFKVLLDTGNTALFVRDIAEKLPKITVQAIGYNLNVLKEELEKIGLTIIIAAKNIKQASGVNFRYNAFRLAKVQVEEPAAQAVDSIDADQEATKPDTTNPIGLSEKTKATLSKLAENAYVAPPLKKLITALLSNNGVVKKTEVHTIMQESGIQSALNEFISHSRRTFRKYGLTLTIDRPFIRIEEIEKEEADDIIDISPQAIFKLAEGMEKEIEKRLEALREELARTQAQLTTTQAQLAELQDQATKAIGHGLQRAETIRNLEIETASARTHAAGLESRLKSAEARAAGLELRATAAEAESAQLKQTAPPSALLAKTKTLEATILEKDARITALEVDLTTARQTLTQVRATVARNASHDTRIEVTAEFAKQIQKLESKISDLEKELRQLNAAQTRTLRLLQQQNLDSPQAVADISELTNEATKLRRRNIELKRLAAEAEARAEIAEAKAQPADVLQLQAEVARLVAELAASKAETLAAKAQPAPSPEDKATISLLERKIAEMQRFMDRKDREYQAELAAKEGTIATLRKQQKAQAPTTNTPSSVNTEASKKLGELQRELAKERDTTYNLREELAATTAQLQDMKKALQGQNSRVVKMEKKGLVDQLREELVELKAENLRLRRTGDSTERANLLALVQSAQEKIAILEQKIKDGTERETKLRDRLSLAPKTPDELAAEELRTRRALAEKVGLGIPRLRELSNLIDFTQKARNTALPMGATRTILGELNGLNSEENFTKTALTAFRDKLQELETAITENTAISKSPRTQPVKDAIRSVISYLSSILNTNNITFNSEKRTEIVNQVKNLLQL